MKSYKFLFLIFWKSGCESKVWFIEMIGREKSAHTYTIYTNSWMTLLTSVYSLMLQCCSHSVHIVLAISYKIEATNQIWMLRTLLSTCAIKFNRKLLLLRADAGVCVCVCAYTANIRHGFKTWNSTCSFNKKIFATNNVIVHNVWEEVSWN